VLLRPVVGEFDPLGKKVEEDTDPKRQEPTLPKIDSVQFVDVARIERLASPSLAWTFPEGGIVLCTPSSDKGQLFTARA
jgi:hypothetical protein